MLTSNKKKISAFYHYCTNGSDFTHDMHEKHYPISPIKSTMNLKMDFVATKNLELSQMPTHHQTNRSSFERQAFENEMLDIEEHSGIKNIKTSKPKPSSVNKEIKNPREFDSFVDNMTDRYIPAILMAPSTPCAKIVVFYHANAEDIGQAYSFCKDINDKLEVSFI